MHNTLKVSLVTWGTSIRTALLSYSYVAPMCCLTSQDAGDCVACVALDMNEWW